MGQDSRFADFAGNILRCAESEVDPVRSVPSQSRSKRGAGLHRRYEHDFGRDPMLGAEIRELFDVV